MLPMLLGLGDAAINKEVDGFLMRFPSPADVGSTHVAEFLKLYPSAVRRDEVGRELVAKGVPAQSVSNAINWIETSQKFNWGTIGGLLSIASAAVSGYHGYRRNKSIPWALAWFVLGGVFPIVTPVIALAQGYAKPK